MRSDKHTYARRRVCGISLSGILLAAATMLFAGCASADQELEQAVDEVQRQANELIAEQTGANGANGASNAPGGEGNIHTVERVLDGDTIEVSPDAAAGNEDVRLLAVDTPETYGGTEPLGPEAKAFTTRKLEGERVRLEYDEDKVDPYDRALAHVRVQGEERTIQEQLLSQGLAQTAWFPPNELYRQELESIQQDARTRGAGIWGLAVSEQCELACRGNGIGEGSAGCEGAS